MTQTSEDIAHDLDTWRETFDSHVRSWLRSLRGDNKSPKTIKIYQDATTALIDHLAGLPPAGRKGAPKDELTRPDDVDEVTRGHIDDLLATRQAATWSAAMAHQCYRSLRVWFNWLVDEEELDRSPMIKMSGPIVPPKAVPVLTDEQITALLGTCKGRDFAQLRDTAIIRLLMDSGGRRQEIASIQLADLDMKLDTVTVLGKGRKKRTIPFGAKTGQALDRYLRARGRQPHASLPALWLAVKRKEPLSHSGLAQMLERRAEQAGIGAIHPHQFRHTMAHNWLSQGGEGTDLDRIMGWEAGEQMRKRYGASAADERAQLAFRRLRLGDRL